MPQEVLLRCIFDSLSLFGENTKIALLDKMRQEGIGFTPETFDIDKFAIVTEDLLGRSADFVFVKILDEFCKRSDKPATELRIALHQSNARMLESLFAIAK
jgi:hypothetical protein